MIKAWLMSRQLLATMVALGFLLSGTLLTPWPATSAGAVTTVAGCDYNGDGYADLAVTSDEAIGTLGSAGTVHVLYGTDQGLSAAGVEVWNQLDSGFGQTPQSKDFFGHALVCGDFDGDGKDELVIAVPGDFLLHVLRGTATGLTDTGSHTISRTDLPTTRTFNFLVTLAAGDFNADGYEELVVATGARLIDSPGEVAVVPGSSTGLQLGAAMAIDQSSPGVSDVSNDWDGFGHALAVGNFDGDSFPDLAIGGPWAEITGVEGGAVWVIPGSAAGLRPTLTTFWHQDTPGIKGKAESRDWFGASLGAGDLDGDGNDDLVIGAYAENDFAGAFNVLYGSSTGLTASGDQYWSLDSPGIKGSSQPHDRFGLRLAVSDFDADGYADLLTGEPRESYGFVTMIPGSSSGLTAVGDERWSQDSPGIKGKAESGDEFGQTLSSGDFDGDGRVDAAIAAIKEGFVPDVGALGVVHILPGGGHGLTAAGDQLWSQASPGVPGAAEQGDQFGIQLAGS